MYMCSPLVSKYVGCKDIHLIEYLIRLSKPHIQGMSRYEGRVGILLSETVE